MNQIAPCASRALQLRNIAPRYRPKNSDFFNLANRLKFVGSAGLGSPSTAVKSGKNGFFPEIAANFLSW